MITYDSGAQELEVLHTGPLHCPDAAPARTMSVTTQSALQDAVELIRAILRDAQHTTG